MSSIKEFVKGLFKENPVFSIVLGLCPVLAVSTSVENALAMGMAVTFVLFFSNLLVSLLRKIIPDSVRIPSFIIIIATFVTIAGMLMEAYLPALNRSLGIFVPLIVVNCIILGRAESFASKNSPLKSIFDGLGMGVGFTLALTLISFIRELIGTAGFSIFGFSFHLPIEGAIMFILPPGALLTMGILLAFFSYKTGKKKVLACHSCDNCGAKHENK